MTQRTARDHEPPAVLATVSVLAGAWAFWLSLLIPPEGATGHILMGLAFAALAVLAGWRTTRVTGRRRTSGTWGRVGLVLGALAVLVLVYQALVLGTDGAVPPPFWAPYRR